MRTLRGDVKYAGSTGSVADAGQFFGVWEIGAATQMTLTRARRWPVAWLCEALDVSRSGFSCVAQQECRQAAGIVMSRRVRRETSKRQTVELRQGEGVDAGEVRLLVQHVIPFPPLFDYAIPKSPAALCLDPIAEQLQRRPRRADDTQRRLGSKRLRPLVDLNDHGHVGQELRIGLVGADHEQEIAVHDAVIRRPGADHADPADPTRIVVQHKVLALDRVDQRRLEPIRQGAEFIDGANVGMPADQRIDFRIGIHLGDVVEESDGDLMGDGVNIAARLEGIAELGAICLSEEPIDRLRGGSISPSPISARPD